MKLATTDYLKNLANIQGSKFTKLNEDDFNQLHSALLIIAADIIRICDENDIPYYLTGGSCLGAIRHKGFIPWDDDMDINIMRRDYAKFMELFKKSYPDKYYIRNPYTKDGYCSIATQIRLKGTVVRTVNDFDNPECGADIDLIVVENTYDNYIARLFHGIISMGLGLIVSSRKFYKERHFLKDYFRYNLDSILVFDIKCFIGFMCSFLSLEKWTLITEKWHSMCKNENSKYVTVPTGRKHFFGELYDRKEYYREYELVPFCGYNWRTFKNYDVYLKKMYGDYMTIPDENKREIHPVIEFRISE